jgi:predicted anti-sigma-YlaC factor YlaD
MTCELARDELSAQLDGERSPTPTTPLAEHLAGCTDCQNWHEAAHHSAGTARLDLADS